MFAIAPIRVRDRAFSILEVLVATSILALLVVLLASVIQLVSSTSRRTSNKIESFQSARIGLQMLTRNLSQAILNTYLDVEVNAAEQPTRYLRKSEFGFRIAKAGATGIPGTQPSGQAVFFQMAAGFTENPDFRDLPGLINTMGYFIRFSDDPGRPDFVQSPPRYRYRLMQLMEPAEQNAIFSAPGQTGDWISGNAIQPVAENIVALVLRAVDPEATPTEITSNYLYDSQDGRTANPQPEWSNQLPPVVEVTLIVMTEESALIHENGTNPPIAVVTALQDRFRETVDYEKDITEIREAFDASSPPIKHQIFTTRIPIAEAKWGRK